MHITAIGDIGVIDDMIHIGDEAMFEALVDALRARGATEITGISANPADSEARYGIRSVASIGFHGLTRDAQEERMRRVRRSAAGERGLLAADDPAWTVIESIRDSDGVTIAGGGNMASNWPGHIFERATIGAIAAAFDRPLVVTGQTIGPPLEPADAALVRELLGAARLVGLREEPSRALCARIGVAPQLLQQTVDDASFLAPAEPIAVSSNAVPNSVRPYCSVTLANHVGNSDSDAFADACATLLDSIAESTGLDIVFFAHFASLSPDSVRGDSAAHERVRAAMTAPSRVEPTTDARAAAAFARGAALGVTSRYHPAVFAAAAGVPTIGIPVDDYTRTKLTGALGHFGQDGLLDGTLLVAGRGDAVVHRVWADRDDIRRRGRALAVAHRADTDAWWNRIAAHLMTP